MIRMESGRRRKDTRRMRMKGRGRKSRMWKKKWTQAGEVGLIRERRGKRKRKKSRKSRKRAGGRKGEGC